MRIIKNPNGTYKIRVYLGRGENNVPISKNITYTPTSTKASDIRREVQRFAADFEEKIKNGRYSDQDRITFRDFSEIWISEYLPHHVAVSTADRYKYILNKDLLPSLGGLRLNRINVLHIQSIIKSMENRKLSPLTIRRRFCVLNSIFTYAYKLGIIDENPCNRAELPKAEANTDLHYFTIDQAKTFLKALTLKYPVTYGPRKQRRGNKEVPVAGYQTYTTFPLQYQVYFTLAIYGGFRRGEMIALTWDDIDFNRHTVSITKSVAKSTDNTQIVKGPKTKAGYRTIMLPDECFTVLAQWLREEKELCMKLGTKWKGYRGDEFSRNNIFIRLDNGKRMDLDTPRHVFCKAIKMYNENFAKTPEDELPMIRLHDLRHTSATLLLAYGADVETVSHRLGHSRASVTLDVYGHALETMDESASDLLGKIFRGNTETNMNV